MFSSGGREFLGSMDTVQSQPATQELGDVDFMDHDETEPWGKLLSMDHKFSAVDLRKDLYTFGRSSECDYCFNKMEFKNHSLFLAYSSTHFKLQRVDTETGLQTVLYDLSSNGTFVNGIKVGKKRNQVLNHNDEISLITKNHKVFVYMDQFVEEDEVAEEILEKYAVSKVLGRGGYGEVRLAFVKGSCKPVAIKIVKKKLLKAGPLEMDIGKRAIREAEILKSLQHPCIVGVEEVYDTSDIVYIVLELVKGGELFDRVISIGSLNESDAKFLFYQMVHAIKFLHDRGIVHRDLKPENILLVSERTDTLIKVTDFGISKLLDGSTMLRTFCGTKAYLAPEILTTAGNGSYTNKVDNWSLGVILFTCLVGYQPFDDESDTPIELQIINGKYSFPKKYWKNISHDAIDLIKKLLTVDPVQRITLEEALNHPWLQDDDIIRKAHHIMYNTSGKHSLKDDLSNTCVPKKRQRR